MKIVNILGGLGNQMFQYAFALALQAEFPDEVVKINKLCFNGYPLHNGFELDQLFEIKLPFASVSDLVKTAYPWVHYRLWQAGRHILPNRHGMVWDSEFDSKQFLCESVKDKSYFDGYWQSERFFGKHKKAIIDAMSFPEIEDEKNHNAIDFTEMGKTAFIHIRRGDYVNHPKYGGICTLDYYKKGIEYLVKNHDFHRFLIFSNDMEWTRKNLDLSGYETMFADWNRGKDSFRDMQLMSKCDGAIIANSSFSWWGAWLGKDKLVVCPSNWTTIPNYRNDIYPRSWIKIEV